MQNNVFVVVAALVEQTVNGCILGFNQHSFNPPYLAPFTSTNYQCGKKHYSYNTKIIYYKYG